MQKDKVEELLTYEEYVEHYKRRIEMRKQNFSQCDEDFFGGQKKSAQIKVVQKFIGKFKSQVKNYEAILAQLDTLNISKYIQEVSNIVATSINEKQITFYAQVATKLNTQYPNVPSIMSKDLIKAFNQHTQSQEDNKPKIKSVFLFTVELFVCGFSFSYKQIMEMIKKVFKCGKNKKYCVSSTASELQSKLFIYCYSCTIFSVLLIHFSQVLTKRTPQWIQIWQKQNKQVYKFPQVLPLKTKDQLTLFFVKYVSECFSLLKQIIELLKNYESQLFECLRLDGEFNKETEKSYIQLTQKFMITKKHLRIIGWALNENLDFKQLDMKITTIQQIMARYIDKAQNATIFQDEFQRQIYENIPQLVTSEQKNITQEQYKQFKQMLQNCKNVNDSNQIAKAFSSINTKKNRKMLAKDILQYRKEYHLVTPYLCRVVTIVNLHFKDIGQAVNDLLFSEYEKNKDTLATTFVINDKKSRIMKYICEFTKFKVIDSDKMMACIQNLIDNLNGYNIQLIVSALENVGRFLHLSQNSANKFTFLMKKYQNIIKKKSLPILTTSQLINSINLLKPRKQMQKPKQHEKTLQQIQAEKAIQLCVINQIDDIIGQIDALMKTQSGFLAVGFQFLRKIQSFDFMNSYNYAYLLQQLNYQKLTNFIVDRTIQNLLLYLSSGENQKTILWAKFLAQLYKYKLLERPLLFSTIENTMKITNNQIGVIHTFCSIFEACISYLDSKKINKKNQRFMLFVQFKKYLSKCKYIPMLEQFQILQIFDQYQPDLSQIDNKILTQFVQFVDNKMKNQSKQISYSDQLDKYLSKRNLKKYQQKIQNKDTRGQPTSPQKPIKNQAQTSTIIQESKLFQKELTSIMEQNRKDYSSRIAKPLLIQKVFEKRKEKKKDGPCITVVGRSGNKFMKKQISKEEQKKKQ